MKTSQNTQQRQSAKKAKYPNQDFIDLEALKQENSEPSRARSMLIVEMVEFSKTKSMTDFVELLSAQIVAADGHEQSPEFGALRDGLMNIKAGLAELYRLQHMHKMRLSFLPLGPEHTVITT